MPQYTDAELVEKTVSSQEIFNGTILRIRLDEAEVPGGGVFKREVVEHPGGVVALAVLPSEKLLLIKQYRYPLGHVLYEFPAGKLDGKEDPRLAIERELEEETGYRAEHWEELTYVYTSPGFCNERLTLFKATGLSLVENAHTEDDEFIEVMEVTPDEVRQMIRERKIVDAKTICAFALVYPLV
jgi:ADP-ribose pyrophosphatase